MNNTLDPRDIVGRKFAYLTAIRYYPNERRGHYYVFRCVCGVERILPSFNVISGNTKSCGCMSNEMRRIKKTRHGKRNTPEYITWSSMRGRCYNPKNQDFKDYGGRGITVCDRWRDSFENFWADMGRKPSKSHTLDRVDNNGPYSPENCRWADKRQQVNNRRTTHRITFAGRTQDLKSWAREYGIEYLTLWHCVVKSHIPLDIVLSFHPNSSGLV